MQEFIGPLVLTDSGIRFEFIKTKGIYVYKDKVYMLGYREQWADWGSEEDDIEDLCVFRINLNLDINSFEELLIKPSTVVQAVPQIVVYQDTIYMAYFQYTGGQTNFYTATMDLDGSNFLETLRIEDTQNWGVYSTLDLENGNIWYSWMEFDQIIESADYYHHGAHVYQLLYDTSNDSLTFFQREPIILTSTPMERYGYHDIEYKNGKVYIIWKALPDVHADYYQLYLGKCNFDGTDWAFSQITSDEINNAHPRIAVTDDHVYFSYVYYVTLARTDTNFDNFEILFQDEDVAPGRMIPIAARGNCIHGAFSLWDSEVSGYVLYTFDYDINSGQYEMIQRITENNAPENVYVNVRSYEFAITLTGDVYYLLVRFDDEIGVAALKHMLQSKCVPFLFKVPYLE